MTHAAHRPLTFSRRDILRAGAATFLGLSLQDLVAFAGTDRPATADHVILIWFSGGMSHIDTFDPKPGRPVAGEFAPIKTSASGIEVSEILPRVAEQMKHATLIRSIAGVEGAHDRAAYHLLTTYRPTPQIIHPSLGSVVAHELAPGCDLPNFVAIGGRAPEASYLGNACEAYYVGAPGQPDPYLRLPQGVAEGRAQRRLAALAEANDGFASGSPDPQLAGTTASYDAALRLMRSPALAAFKLEEEPAAVREAYGDSSFGRGCLLARRLIDRGVRFVQVSAGGFDTHSNNFSSLRRLSHDFDPAIGALIGDLAASGKLDRTLILTLSEFGRTPRINGDAGRDHHPGVFSSLLAGGGIRRGNLHGSSDADGSKPAEKPVTPSDLHASVCHALGIDPEKTVQTPLRRPMQLVDKGTPVTELFKA
ncbi:MAG: DUF1501 domain-containing protein [Planctomycetota bacterium]|nr:DUF1501 domain-containing protein [Planctomycetota bacterium]